MPGASYLRIAMFATIWIVSACVNVSQPAPTGSPVAPPTDAGAQATTTTATALPTVEPSTELEQPTTEPTQATEPTPTAASEPTPTEPPEKTDPPQTGPKPNLRVQKLEPDQLPVVVGAPATFTADITNFADTAAGPFVVEFVLAGDGQDDLVLDTYLVDALAAGAATQRSTSITLNVPGGVRVIARVDAFDQVAETDESDNERVLEVIVEQNSINLTVPSDGLTVTSAGNPDAPNSYLFTISMTNSGQSRVVGTMTVHYFGYNANQEEVDWGTFDFDLDLAPGDPFNQLIARTVEPGSYRAYALADSGEVWPETDETDNEATVDFTAP
jgi:hypothetical protein